MRRCLLALALSLAALPAFAAMQAKPIEWSVGKDRFSGYVVYDDASAAKRPGLVMVPNWMGVTEDAVERAKAERRTERIRTATYAKRFAAKEAASKALGTGFRAGVFWRDLGVVNLPSGQPTLALTGHAAEHLARMTPPGHTVRIHLTLSDEHPYALAFVVIEALPGA